MSAIWNVTDKFTFPIQPLEERIDDLNIAEFTHASLDVVLTLRSLVENGLAERSVNSINISFGQAILLDHYDRMVLGFPGDYPYLIHVFAHGVPASSEFSLGVRLVDFYPNGNFLKAEILGPLVRTEFGDYFLNEVQFNLLRTVENFNVQTKELEFEEKLKALAKLTSYAEFDFIIVDDSILQLNVVTVERIEADLFVDEQNTPNVVPMVPGIDNESLSKQFTKRPKAVINVRNTDGTSKRVVLDKGQLEALKQLNIAVQSQTLEENEDLILSDFEDVIDLTNFSARVREYGHYKPKFYPFISPYKSQWIPGYEVKDKVDGVKRVHFKSSEELMELKELVELAEGAGQKSLVYKGDKLETNFAKELIQIAERQLRIPDSDPEKFGELSSKVLIIKENAELLEYEETTGAADTLIHEFYEVDNLDSSIKLKAHQIEGVSWLQSLFKSGFRGGLLADDMGLGKTLQILYFIEWVAKHTDNNKPSLIVAPVSLLENWEREYNRFFNPSTLEVLTISGIEGMSRHYSANLVQRLQQKRILLTSYETLRINQLNIAALDLAVVVLDEAQKVKTPGTLVTNAVKALKADFKIAATGTPVENTFLDLWCIMDFALPGLLGDAREFARRYQNPLKSADTNLEELGNEIRKRIGVFIKRRLKVDVATELPSKIEHVVHREMPEIQFNRYWSVVKSLKDDQEDGNSGSKILQALSTLRDISDHPYLVDSQITMYSVDQLIKASAKLQTTIEELEKIRLRGEKVIVFADRKETQRMLQKVVTEYFNIPSPSIVNGDTPAGSISKRSQRLTRQQTIDLFQSKPGFNVIIMSPIAAGIGLNIVSANHVIHYSRHWNPAKEDQATDRAYRIGQEKEVFVYYPLAVFPRHADLDKEGVRSFDMILDELLKRKKTLATHTLWPSEMQEVNLDEFKGALFGISDVNTRKEMILFHDIAKLNPRHFEAFAACYYKEMGCDVKLTPLANDKGADVIANSSEGNYLIQVKQSQTPVAADAVQEIVTAKNYYSQFNKVDFKLVVFTNNSFTPNAIELARVNQVELIDGINLESNYSNSISRTDLLQLESQRLLRV
jgi:SNF2 family DNA or RNA helicase/HJR/Mrr/RecB family endonuclease